jgi:predicted nucleic acid-binding protein
MTARNGSSAAFVDTNILIYVVSPSDRRSATANRLVEELLSSERFRTSTQVLQEFVAVATQKIESKLSIRATLEYLELWTTCHVVPIDCPAIRAAAHLSADRQLSFWDGLIVVAAKRCGATRLYTEDLNHGQIIEGVEVVNPFR